MILHDFDGGGERGGGQNKRREGKRGVEGQIFF